MSGNYFGFLLFICAVNSSSKGDCIHGRARLVDGLDSNEGRLELCLYAHWGSVPYWYFGYYDAKVVCRMLGYDVDSDGAYWNYDVYYYYYYIYPTSNSSVWMIFPQCEGSERNILDCNMIIYPTSISSHINDLVIICQKYQCNDGDVRLFGGLVDSEGTVELCQNGSWNSLCSYNWGYQEAFVVCNQLGLPATEIQWFGYAMFGEGHGTPTLDNWRCIGNESSLAECLYSNDSICYDPYDVGVSCRGLEVKATCIPGSMRLVGPDGHNMVEGRVEYCSNGIWGTVSDNGFDTRDGEVVCRRLGYQQPRVQIFHSSYYGQGTGPILYDSMSCDGSESKFEDCSFGLYPYYDYHSGDVGVHCYEKTLTSCNNSDVRLVNGSSPDEGRVELCFQGEWGTVYDSSWDKRDAQVVCRQLGYQPGYATAYRGSYFGYGDLSVIASSAQCSGSESALSNCGLSTENVYGYVGDTAGLRCYAPTGCSDGEVRLIGGETDKEGDVQICQQGVWGYACGYYWNWNYYEARAVCQQLNYSASWYSYSFGSFFTGNSDNLKAPIVIDRYDCSSSDTTLSDCNAYGYGTYEAYCDSAGGVMCEEDANCTDGSVQLVDGDSSSEGRVELCSNGVWTTIQDINWDYNDARVVCRQLGYYDEWTVAITGSYFTSGRSRIYYASVYCIGDEQQLIDCPTYTYSIYDTLNYWYNSKRAGVSCQSNSSADSCSANGSIRLIGGANEREGRVEVCLGGYWGTVCSDEWSEEDALVVCRQAGYDTLRPVPLTNSSFGRGSGPVHMTSLSCGGTEEHITECGYSNGIGADNCHHGRDAGVVCTSGSPMYYSINIRTRPSEGPFPIGSVVSLDCGVSSDPPTGSTYQWRTTVPGVKITHKDSSHPNATITIPVGHTKYGYYYCLVQSNGSTLATGFEIIEVKQLLFSSQTKSIASTGMTVTLQLNKTVTTIDSYLWQLNWYHDMTKTDFNIPLQTDSIKYILGADNMSLTILDLNVDDAGIYTARYDGLLLYPHDSTCEQQLLQALRHYPVLESVTFTLSVDGSDTNYFGDPRSYFAKNKFTTSFSDKETVTMNTTAANLLSDTIYMTRLKDGNQNYFSETESLFYSEGYAYRELHLAKPTITHSGNYEAQLQLTSSFMGYECNSIYTNFISSVSYLGIDGGVVILQSTMQRLAYYESPEIRLTSDVLVFDLQQEATLHCTAVGGYPAIHNISLVKNGQVILNRISDEIMLTTSGGLPKNVYGLYECIVNNTAETTTSTLLLQHKASFMLMMEVGNCEQWDDKSMTATEIAILDLLQKYCACPMDKTTFHNSTSSCSRGVVTFSSILAHASDDGSVTASTLIETMEAAIAKEENPTITVDGQTLAVQVPEDDTSEPPTAIYLFFGGFFTAFLVCVVACFIFAGAVVVWKKRKTSSRPQVNEEYIDMEYEAKTRKTHSQPTSPLQRHYVNPPTSLTVAMPTHKFKSKEAREEEEEVYEIVDNL